MSYLVDPNCQLAYLMREGAGESVFDHSKHSRSGSFNQAAHPQWSSDVPTYGNGQTAAGFSLVFSATTGEILDILFNSSADVICPSNGAWTIVSWCNPTIDHFDSGVDQGDPRFLDRGSVVVALLQTKSLSIVIGGDTAMIRASVDNTISFNAWQHCAFVFDGNATAFVNQKIYRNGVEVSYGNTTFPDQNGVNPTSNSGAQATLGNRNDGKRSFGGKLKDFAVFNRQLSAAEILDIYTNGLGEPEVPVTWFPQGATSGRAPDLVIPSGML